MVKTFDRMYDMEKNCFTLFFIIIPYSIKENYKDSVKQIQCHSKTVIFFVYWTNNCFK